MGQRREESKKECVFMSQLPVWTTGLCLMGASERHSPHEEDSVFTPQLPALSGCPRGSDSPVLSACSRCGQIMFLKPEKALEQRDDGGRGRELSEHRCLQILWM